LSKSIKKKNLYHKIKFLIPLTYKKQLMGLGLLLLIGLFFEMLGLGIIIPILAILLSNNISNEYPSIIPLLKMLGNPTQDHLIILGLLTLVIIYVFKGVFMIFLSWKQAKFSSELYVFFSNKLFLGYLFQPYTFHLQKNSAILLRNIQGEVGAFNGISQAVISLLIEISGALGVCLMLLIVEPLGAIVVTLFLVFSGLVFHNLTKKKLLNWGRNRQQHEGEMNQHLMQGLNGVKEVKLLGKEEYFLSQFNKHNVERGNITAKQITLQQVPRTYLEILAVVGLAVLILTMLLQHKSLQILVPTLGIFVAAAFRMIPSANRIMNLNSQIKFAQPVIDLLYKEFRDISDFEKTNVGIDLKSEFKFNNKIELKNLTFKYNESAPNAIENLNIVIKKGESVGIIGHSGSGKSTLIDLMLGLLLPKSGDIVIDGININNNNQRSWQKKIGYVPQSIYLIDSTLRKNIAFGVPDDKIDESAIIRSVKAAQLDDYISSLEDGLDTFVGERGVRLSGGQRQRIGIARALYYDPEILLLDEATSALDTQTELGVMSSVSAMKGNKTLLIVAHRLSTVEKCDKIYKLAKGKVVEEGLPSLILNLK
jgi:ABC-type multidrug transport system fused ATPase/permease subunit